MKSKSIAAAVVAATLAAPVAAQAHVTLQPEEVPAGSFARLDVRVPNESDKAATDTIEMELPDGFLFVSYEPVEGWSTEVQTEELDEPAEAFGEEISEQVDAITWTADDPDAAVQPGQFQDFGLSVGLPEDAPAGEELTFPVVQTYDDGEVSRWIGDPDSEEPAPIVTLTEAEADHLEEEEAGEAEETADEAVEEADEAVAEADDDGGSNGLAVAGLIVGALGLITGGTALARSRKN